MAWASNTIKIRHHMNASGIQYTRIKLQDVAWFWVKNVIKHWTKERSVIGRLLATTLESRGSSFLCRQAELAACKVNNDLLPSLKNIFLRRWYSEHLMIIWILVLKTSVLQVNLPEQYLTDEGSWSWQYSFVFRWNLLPVLGLKPILSPELF